MKCPECGKCIPKDVKNVTFAVMILLRDEKKTSHEIVKDKLTSPPYLPLQTFEPVDMKVFATYFTR